LAKNYFAFIAGSAETKKIGNITGATKMKYLRRQRNTTKITEKKSLPKVGSGMKKIKMQGRLD
jgi:hypothetical protein